ncbi:glycoside hydrolase family 19 protein [Kosakonia sacchari]|uniref:glycoside hydrolase family 19 protein n=1 Tax=Kosakonia sacchari TaxID=1158459 RepID=UPI001584B1A1|nr:glycoside hydrolase family 19 protein [Kosakonia sacchari]NUL36344.1 glycoside hydrolase family 19 protein [Kosakonia sacchari]HDT2145339.1 glycoside hydrolase family 19 protein [Enterobacter roggenkampii]
MLLTLPQFQRAAGLSPVMAQRWFEPFSNAAAEFQINTPARLAAFIAQTGHESTGFSRLSENLYYTDAERVARIFRSGFDTNKNGVIEPSEVAFARAYTRNPEKLANRAYAGRGGNGDEASGDGWRYRGRGLIQVTFRDNYFRCGKALGLDLIATPDLLLEYVNAARSAAWYWQTNGCNELADKGDFLAVTRRINPPAEGQADRLARLEVARAAL